MKVRAPLFRVHRWLSLAMLGFWLIQGLTGMAIAFQKDIDDATIAAPHRPTDVAALDRRISALAPAGSGKSIGSIWISAGQRDRYDINVADANTRSVETVRVDGAGNILRVRDGSAGLSVGSFLEGMNLLHRKLLTGNTGSWIVTFSGMLLLSNIVMGLTVAWPRTGAWRQAIVPSRSANATARLYRWHRAVGLWAAIPAALLVSAGILLQFEHGLERTLRPVPIVAPKEAPRGSSRLSFAEAAKIALARYPGATLSGIEFPTDSNATWRFRLRQPGELRRAYGNTNVFVSANDGRILAVADALRADLPRRFINFLVPFHSGELGGTPGRLAVMSIGLWLVTMIAFGVSLWLVRRRRTA